MQITAKQPQPNSIYEETIEPTMTDEHQIALESLAAASGGLSGCGPYVHYTMDAAFVWYRGDDAFLGACDKGTLRSLTRDEFSQFDAAGGFLQEPGASFVQQPLDIDDRDSPIWSAPF